KGIIKFCSISVNLEKIGYQGTAHLLLRVSASVNPIDAIDNIKKISNIIIASTAIGDYEGYAVVAFRDTKDLTEKIFEIKKVKGIQKVEFLIAVPGIENFPITNYSTK
ncbi:MAG: hypothetical protein NWF03_08510, partial [Candidatus Bathyarchaeota archaeon]|nr:hypothetical protein [Candidatus Bathyarchaeota archaeon]